MVTFGFRDRTFKREATDGMTEGFLSVEDVDELLELGVVELEEPDEGGGTELACVRLEIESNVGRNNPSYWFKIIYVRLINGWSNDENDIDDEYERIFKYEVNSSLTLSYCCS